MTNKNAPKYRIIQDGNGGFTAQKRHNIRDGHGEDAWVFFKDLEPFDDLEGAEAALKAAIMRSRQRIVGVYDEDGDRIL